MKREMAAIGAVWALAMPAFAAPVALGGWTAEGAPGQHNWTVAGDGNSVFQSINGQPTVFYSDFNGQGRALSGKIRVETTGDDDYIGFVLGFQPGDRAAASTDFILVDWKQLNQGSYGCNADIGLSISRVTGGLPEAAASWCHSGTTQELQRGATLGSTGWADNTEYSFDLIFTATNIQVLVNGVQELNVAGTFQDGRFGFYNYSQSSVRYSAIEEDVVVDPDPNAVPEPMSLALVGLGLAGLAASRRRKA